MIDLTSIRLGAGSVQLGGLVGIGLGLIVGLPNTHSVAFRDTPEPGPRRDRPQAVVEPAYWTLIGVVTRRFASIPGGEGNDDA